MISRVKPCPPSARPVVAPQSALPTRRLAGLVILLALAVPAAPAPAATCEPLADATTLLEAGSVVLLGELHGTAEAPAALGRLACAALALSAEVTVALEIPEVEQAAIDRYLAGTMDLETLAGGPFWTRSYQDGRSSLAMLELLETLGSLRSDHASLRVAAIDRPDPPQDRDRAMAERIASLAAARSDGIVLALTGNLHTRLSPGTPFDPRHEPMGYLLRRLLPEARLHSIDLSHEAGTAWICTGPAISDCGAHTVGGSEPREERLHFRLLDPGEPFTAELHLGPITASPPVHGNDGASRGADGG